MAGTNHVLALSRARPTSDQDLSSLACVMPAGGAVSAILQSSSCRLPVQVSPGTAARLRTLLPGLTFIYQFYGSTEVCCPVLPCTALCRPGVRGLRLG